MNIAAIILKEAGARFTNAAGSIKSDSNMYEGAHKDTYGQKALKMMNGGGMPGMQGQDGENKDDKEKNEIQQNIGDSGLNEAAGGAGDAGSVASDIGDFSDARLKEILGEKAPLDAFAAINTYLYKYRPEARAMYGDAYGVDGNEHVGVMAQELAINPLTSDTVKVDENGYMMVDTDRLCLVLAAVTADLSRRVQELEEKNAKLVKDEGEKKDEKTE